MDDQRFQNEQSVSDVENASKISDVQVTGNILSCVKEKANTLSGIIVKYLLREVPDFRRLSELREQVKSDSRL
jgi:hypothetical protein